MVKRIFGSLMLVLIATVSILAQIDWTKQVKNQPNVLQGSLFGIRVVDGVKFAKSAAGINAADADLGSAIGEVWVLPGGNTATDAQISITTGHTLRVFGQITIDALNKGPILLGGNARIVCPGNFGTNILNTSAQTNISSMVRLSTQDGSLGGIEIDGCRFDAVGSTVTNGVIDASGATGGPSWIKDNLITGFVSAWGIFIQDIQSGALAGTNNVQMVNNRITPTGTGGCIEILHSATNAVVLTGFEIQDTNCVGGSSLTTSDVLIQNTSAGANLTKVNVLNLLINGASTAHGLNLNGVEAATVKHVFCANSANCVNIPSNTQNLGISVDNASCFVCTNALSDAANSFANPFNYTGHYDFVSSNSTWNGSYLNAVSYLRVNGPIPSTPTVAGCGTGCTGSMDTGSTNNAGVVSLNTGTTPASTGTVQVNFNTTQLAQFAPNLPPPCIFGLTDSNSAWVTGAAAKMQSWTSNNILAFWSNNGTNLTASQAGAYKLTYICFGK